MDRRWNTIRTRTATIFSCWVNDVDRVELTIVRNGSSFIAVTDRTAVHLAAINTNEADAGLVAIRVAELLAGPVVPRGPLALVDGPAIANAV